MAQKTYNVIKSEKKRTYQVTSVVTSQIIVMKETWNVLHNLCSITNYPNKQLKLSTVEKYAAASMKGDQRWMS